MRPDQKEQPDLFRTRDHVADFDAYVARYAEHSAATRKALSCQLDVGYGQEKSETLDIFFPDQCSEPAPVHLFVHGGYWRMFDKRDFSFVANTVTRAGAIAAIMGYSLMPSVRLATIVSQVQRAARWLSEHARQFGGDGTRLSVSGHSVGAHLGAMLLHESNPVQPSGSLLLSGVYDIEPLRQSFLQPQIGITGEEAERFSPLRQPIVPSGPVRILVGEYETLPFHAQAAQFADITGTVVETIKGGNHMSVALDLGDPESAVGQALWAVCS